MLLNIGPRRSDASTIGLPLGVDRTAEQFGYVIPPPWRHGHQSGAGSSGNGDGDFFARLHTAHQLGCFLA